ncbi:MAG TPA: P-type conjugative transfer protein TrbL, partial [Thiobacillus sp.]|nr:P-type conjugative transfer protein TrbL [Thiobacillus sp.]
AGRAIATLGAGVLAAVSGAAARGFTAGAGRADAEEGVTADWAGARAGDTVAAGVDGMGVAFGTAGAAAGGEGDPGGGG